MDPAPAPHSRVYSMCVRYGGRSWQISDRGKQKQERACTELRFIQLLGFELLS